MKILVENSRNGTGDITDVERSRRNKTAGVLLDNDSFAIGGSDDNLQSTKLACKTIADLGLRCKVSAELP